MSTRLTDEESRVAGRFMGSAFQMPSIIDIVVISVCAWESYMYHPMQAEDRLGNKACDFPIAFCFGDTDIHGSEGADELVKMNPHFESGRS